MISTAIWLATSPLSWPPMPSAQTKRSRPSRRCDQPPVVFVEHAAEAHVGHGPASRGARRARGPASPEAASEGMGDEDDVVIAPAKNSWTWSP